MKRFDDYIGELMNTLSGVAENYDLLPAPREEVQGYAERVRLRARLTSMATLIHWMALDLAALDGIAEETRRVAARYESIAAARRLIDDITGGVGSPSSPIPAAPDSEEEESARVRMAAIGVTPPEDMSYARYAEIIDGSLGGMMHSA
jgi:hypothetical protein